MRWVIGLALAGSLFGQDAATRPKILGLARASFYVTDVAKARAFYVDLLGYPPLPVAGRSDVSDTIQINEKQYVKLVSRAEAGDQLVSIAFQTENAVRLRGYLASRGVAVPDSVFRDNDRNWRFSVQDPDGHTIEFVEYERDWMAKRWMDPRLMSKRISAHMTHAGVIVGSLSRAMKFYQDVLGFEETWRGGAGPTLSWVNLRVPDGTDYIEFMLYSTIPSPDRRGGQHHICLVVPDMAKAVADLESRPARKSYSRSIESRVGVNRKRQANLFDPDGTRVELMEPVTVDGKVTPPSTAPAPIP